VTTVLWPGREPFECEGLLVDPERLGWEAKPEGLCRGELCVPFEVDAQGRVDVRAFAERLGAAVVQEGDVLAFGPATQRPPLAEAPDFTLPDLEGRPHSLSDYRGTKVLLVTWASW
jgi:hypothetical protein